MKITGPLKDSLDELSAHHAQTKSLEEALLRSLFSQIPTLNSFEVRYEHDNFSEENFILESVNGVIWEDYDEEGDLITLESDNEEHQSWLVEINFTTEEFKMFLLALRRLEKHNWTSGISIKREKVA